MLDTNAEHSALQPENAIVIKPWEGKGGERGLVDLIPFLECESASLPHGQRRIPETLANSYRNLQPA